MATDNAKVTFSAGRLVARSKAPYLRALLYSFAPVEAPGLGTIGVTEHGVMVIDWDFVDKVTPEEMGGLLVHECMHILLKHAERARLASYDAKTANIAMDMAINSSVWNMGLKLPGGGPKMTVDHPLHGQYPEEHDWEPGLTMDEYYARLRREQQDSKSSKKQGQKGADSPNTAGGFCGSCAGRPMPGEPDKQDKISRTDNEMHRISRAVAEAVREHEQSTQGRGTVPAMLKRWADAFLTPPEIPWQKELAVITRTACAWRDHAVDHRYDAPSRRQGGIGFGPGKPILPRFRMPVPNVAVILDTSGSMGNQELSEATREVNGILKAIGAEVTFVTCDAAVSGITKVRTIKEALSRLTGGGGTDMAPAFAALMKERTKPEVIVCLTDLCIGDPGPPPRGAKVIWVAVGKFAASMSDPAWGKTVRTTNAKASPRSS